MRSAASPGRSSVARQNAHVAGSGSSMGMILGAGIAPTMNDYPSDAY